MEPNLPIDLSPVLEFMTTLLNTPSPTGFTEDAIGVVERALTALELPYLELRHTVKGALVATLPGAAEDAPRALSAHVDTLGAMVREVKSNGRLLLTQLGGFTWETLESENVTVHALSQDATLRGTIQMVHPSVHTDREARDGKRSDENMEVRLDARTTSADETRALGIEVGDFVSFDPRVEITDTGYVKSRFLDDKACVAVLYGVLRALKAAGAQPAQRTSFFISPYEEVGHGASAGIPADVVELLVLDMGAATTGEHQRSDEHVVNICAKDSTGPYDLVLRRRLVALCQREEIPYRVDTYPFYGSDGSALLRAGADLRVGLIGPGVDASHGYERTHSNSLAASIRLALAYVMDAGR